MIVSDLLVRNVRNRPQKEAIFCEPCQIRLTYYELNVRVNRLCNMLLDEHVQKGDRIAVVSSNCHIHPELIMAVAKAGWVLVEIDHRLSTREIQYILEDSQSQVLFVGEDLEDVTSSLPSILPKLKRITFSDYKDITDSYSDKEPEIDVSEDDIITLMYTSGTTGDAKGVIYTHKNLSAALTNMVAMLKVREDDKALHTSPFSHIAPIWPFLLHCYYGGSNVIINNIKPIHILEVIESEKITTWNTVPVVISRIVDTEGKEHVDVSSLRWISYGASAIQLPVLKKALRFFGNILNQVYGCTETYVISFLQDRYHKLEGGERELRRLSSCGLEMINTETIVVKQNGSEVKAGEVGEVITRGDHIGPGYWRKENETAQSYKDGYFYTGDLAAKDSDGFIYIRSRRKDIIVSGGENISPNEVENVLHDHESVSDATVVGLPHKVWGEAVTAFVILYPGQVVTEDDLIAFCRGKLAGFKCPKSFIFVDDFPRTTSGKILKRKLRDLYIDYFE